MSPTALEASPLFTPWHDPRSGVESLLLSRRVAPLQQSFYYVNQSFTDDGRFLWVYCAFPPNGDANQGRTLAVVDLHAGELRHFPETGFLDASPAVDLANGTVYWCSGAELWRRGPLAEDRPILVNRLPDSIVRNRRPWRVATHLTFSPDKRALNFDAEIGRQWIVGHFPLDGSAPVVWKELDRAYNHAQFSPRVPNLQLVNQDSAVDPVTGNCPSYENRMWLTRPDGSHSPIYRDAEASGAAKHGHEWWSADGRHVWYIHYNRGVARVDPFADKPREEIMWKSDTVSHAHTDTTGRLIVADCIPGPATGIYRVLFINLNTGREVEIVSHMDYPPDTLKRFHVHAHPQFCLQDRYVCYTTFVHQRVDVALVPVARLLALTT